VKIAQFKDIRAAIKPVAAARDLGDDIVIQGSRAKYTAKPTSDIDFGILVDDNVFQREWNRAFADKTVGSSAWKTGQHALAVGKINSRQAKLSSLRDKLAEVVGKKAQIAILRKSSFKDFPVIKVD
jgi:predicted nucleotidyltransferase